MQGIKAYYAYLESNRIDACCGDKKDFRTLIGLEQKDFEEVVENAKAIMRPSHCRTRRDAVAIALLKMRTALSHRIIAPLFNTDYNTVRASFTLGLDALAKTLLPRMQLTREEVIMNHTSPIASQLYSNALVLVVDVTCVPVEKEPHHRGSKYVFCLHRHKYCVSVQFIVTTTGKVVAVSHPCASDRTNNDARVFQYCYQSNEDLQDFLLSTEESPTVLICDRG